jgi:hypothetical protein
MVERNLSCKNQLPFLNGIWQFTITKFQASYWISLFQTLHAAEINILEGEQILPRRFDNMKINAVDSINLQIQRHNICRSYHR